MSYDPAKPFVMANRLALPCKVCGQAVPMGAGYAVKVGTEWSTYCAGHLPYPKPLTEEQKQRKFAEDAERSLRWEGDAVATYPDPESHRATNGFAPFRYQVEGAAWLRGRRRALLADDQGVGKALPVDAPVLTPSGWQPIGELRVNDHVVDPTDGSFCRVVGVYPQGMRPAYRVTFSDGATTICDPDHLWAVNTPSRKSRGNPWMVRSLWQVVEAGIKDGAGNRKWFVPLAAAPCYNPQPQPLPVHPYVLGYLLGNGSLTGSSPGVTIPDPSTAIRIQEWLPEGVYAKRGSRPIDYRLTSDDEGECANPLLDALEALGLMGHGAADKAIPPTYLLAGPEDRELLLQGLMDSDGWCSNNVLGFGSTSVALRDGVVDLVRSLGGIATATGPEPQSYVNAAGERVECLDRYRTTIALPEGVRPFLLARKAEQYQGRSKYQPSRSIESVEPCGEAEMVCIAVDGAAKLYITGDYVVTHNTVQALLALPEGRHCRSLIVTPASVKHNWAAECARWRPDLKVRVEEGTRGGAMRFRPDAGEVVICNYDILPPSEKAPQLAGGTVVIADEAQAMKNYKTSRHKRFKALLRDNVRAWLLTGTPMLNRPPDLWGVLEAGGMERAAFGSWGRFCGLMGGRKGRFGMEWHGKASPEVPSLLRRAMLRRLKSEVLAELPPKRFQDLRVEGLDPGLKAELDRAWNEYNSYLQRKPDGDLPPFEMFSAVRAKVAEAKTIVAVEWIGDYIASQEGVEDPRPLVVMSAHRHPVEAIAAKFGFATITGDTRAEDRTRIVAEFQAGRLPGVACTIQAAGVGLTLTRADTMLFVDLDWTPANNRQAQDRIHRVGAEGERCLYVSLVAGHVLEEHIHRLLMEKQEQQHAAIDAPGADIVRATGEEIRSESDEEFAARLAEIERATREREDREEAARAEREAAAMATRERIERSKAEARENLERQRAERAKGRATVIRDREKAKAKEAGVRTPRLSAERAQATREAVRYLASVCDGAHTKDYRGFNKPDSQIGAILALAGLEDGSPALEAAYLIVRRYPRQVRERWPVLWGQAAPAIADTDVTVLSNEERDRFVALIEPTPQGDSARAVGPPASAEPARKSTTDSGETFRMAGACVPGRQMTLF